MCRNIKFRDLERTSCRWVDNSKVDTRQHFENIVLPKKHAPVRISTKCYHVSFLILWTECNAKELLSFVVNFLILLRYDLLSLFCLHVDYGALCSYFTFLTDSEEFLSG